jgi:hypothetical protein
MHKIYNIPHFFTISAPDPDKEVGDAEKRVIRKIFREAKISEDVQYYHFLNEKIGYKSFFVSTLSKNEKEHFIKTYIVKIAPSDTGFLSTERAVLESPNIAPMASPKLIAYGKLKKKAEYSITSARRMKNASLVSDSDFLTYLEIFSSVVDSIHECGATNLPSFEDRIELCTSVVDLYKDMDQRNNLMLKAIADGINHDSLKKLYQTVNKEILKQKPTDDWIPVVSHFNIKKSNILLEPLTGLVQIINYDHAHKTDLFLSLFQVVNSLKLNSSPALLKRFLKYYFEHSPSVVAAKFNEFHKFEASYKSRERFAALVVFHDILSQLLSQIYFFGPFAQKDKLHSFADYYLGIRDLIKDVINTDLVDPLFFHCTNQGSAVNIQDLRAKLKSLDSEYSVE